MAQEELIALVRAETDQFRKDMNELSRRVDRNSTKMTKSFKKVDSAVKVATKGMNLMKGAAAALGVAMGVQLVRGSFAFADAIGKTADKLGIGVEALQEWRFVAQQSGVSQEALQMGMQRFIRRLGEAQAGTGVLKDALAAMNINLKDQAGRTREGEDVFTEYLTKLGQVEDQTTKLSLAQKAFDSEGVALVGIVTNGADAMEQMRQQARDLGLVMDESMIRNAEKANDELSIMFNVLQMQVTQAIVSLAPTVINLGTAFQQVVMALRGNQKAFAELSEGMQVAIGVIKFMWDLLKKLADAWMFIFKIVGKFLAQLVKLPAPLLKKFGLEVGNLKDFFIDLGKGAEDAGESMEMAAKEPQKEYGKLDQTLLQTTLRQKTLAKESKAAAAAAKKAAQEAKKAEEERLAALEAVEDEIAGLTMSTTELATREFNKRVAEYEKAGVDQMKIAELREAFFRDQIKQTTERVNADIKRRNEEQKRSYEAMASRIQSTLETQIFDVMKNGFQSTKDVMTSLKDWFFKIIAQMAAKALATPIMMSLGMQAPGGGLLQAAGGGLLGQLGQAGGVLGAAGRLLPAAGVGVGAGMLGARAIGALGGGERTQRIGGAAIGGAATGFMVGGPLGAAVGAGVGAVGGWVAGLFKKKKKDPPPPEFKIMTSDIVFKAGQDALEAVEINLGAAGRELGARGLPEAADAIKGAASQLFQPLVAQVNQLAPELRDQAVGPLNQLADKFEETLNDVRFEGDNIAEQIQQFIGEEMPAEFQKIFGAFSENIQKALPIIQGLGDVVKELESRRDAMLESLREARVGIQEAFFTPAQKFEARRQQLRTLRTELRTADPARQVELVPEIQALTQELFGLAQQEEVMGQDMQLLREFQGEMLGVMDELENVTATSFDTQIDAAKEQLDVLKDIENLTDAQLSEANATLEEIRAFLSGEKLPELEKKEQQEKKAVKATLRGPENIGQALTEHGEAVKEAFGTIQTIQKEGAKGFAERFLTKKFGEERAAAMLAEATPAQEGGFVQRGGAAILHAGERVIPANGGNGATRIEAPINITISGTEDPEAIVMKIEDVLVPRLEELARFGRTKLVAKER